MTAYQYCVDTWIVLPAVNIVKNLQILQMFGSGDHFQTHII